jgi:hypothetical protein
MKDTSPAFTASSGTKVLVKPEDGFRIPTAPPGNLQHLPLIRLPLGPSLVEPGGDDDDVLHPLALTISHHTGHQVRRNGDDDHVNAVRNVRNGWKSSKALYF